MRNGKTQWTNRTVVGILLTTDNKFNPTHLIKHLTDKLSPCLTLHTTNTMQIDIIVYGL